ncbi:ABC transporter permease subunit [Microcella daejeonensis]|uniref:ABC transporter permease subunit n=1 Tax=Microcella daejeonensis TaxID=2994971 RepID=UPI002270C2CB|nr:ABC transporter permease subunit [Microcella daejeonensis]WAB84664.1 ABC transporter permease subunit [Microcella daejeonensis]
MTGTRTTDAPTGIPNRTPGSGVSFARVVRSEWIKLRTLRSTVWSFATIVVLTVAFGLLFAGVYDGSFGPEQDQSGQNSIAVVSATAAVTLTQLIAAVLGVLIISGEHTTGMIRSTLTAVPRRLPAYAAKALVLAVSTAVIGLLAIGVTLLITLPNLAGKGIEPDLLDADVLRSLLGAAAYLALIALLAYGFGAMLRSSAGGIATAIGLIFMLPTALPIIALFSQATWITNAAAFLPSNAGARMYALNTGEPEPFTAAGADPSEIITLDPGQGALVLVAWVVVILALGAVLLKRRDA